MPYPTDDLTPLLVPSNEDTGPLLFAEGKLISFNPDTLENEVAFRGGVARNLRVAASGFDALTWEPGNLLELRGYAPRRGSAVWWIGGRIITPGPGAADILLAGMTTTLAKRIAAAVLAERFDNAIVPDNETTSSTTYTDLATLGPQVTGVDVSESGTLLVILGCSVNVGNNGGYMSFELSGPSTLAPDNSRAVGHGTAAGNHFIEASRLVLVTGLNPGTYTVTAKYINPNGSGTVAFNFRTLTTIGL